MGKLHSLASPGLTSRGVQQRACWHQRTFKKVFCTCELTLQVLYPSNLQSHSSDLQGPVYGENHLKFPSLSMP